MLANPENSRINPLPPSFFAGYLLRRLKISGNHIIYRHGRSGAKIRVKALLNIQSSYEKNGFTLLEVLAAVVILGLAYVAVLQSFSLSMRNIEKVDKSRRAVFDERLAFSRASIFTGAESLGEDEAEGEVFIEGLKYQLVEVLSDTGEMATLQMQNAL